MRPRQYQILVAAATVAFGFWFLTMRLHDLKPRWNQAVGVYVDDGKLDLFFFYFSHKNPVLMTFLCDRERKFAIRTNVNRIKRRITKNPRRGIKASEHLHGIR